MQRTQIYFEQQTLDELKKMARSFNISVSELIRSVVKKEIIKHKNSDIQAFVKDMKPVESFKDTDATAYVQNIRGKSRILHD